MSHYRNIYFAYAIVLGALAIVASACTHRGTTTTCTPGTSIACTCTGGAVGTQTCAASRAFGSCDCSGVVTDMGTATDMTSATDGEAIADFGTDASTLGDASVGRDAALALDGAVSCRSALECDDENPCTDDACTSALCVHTANAATCDDGLFCTTADHCARSTCIGSTRGVCPTGCICVERSMSCEPDPASGDVLCPL